MKSMKLYHYCDVKKTITIGGEEGISLSDTHCKGLWISTVDTPRSWNTWRAEVDNSIHLAEDMRALYKVEIKNHDRILFIDTIEKLNKALKYYPTSHFNDGFNWLAMSKDYDGFFMLSAVSQSKENKNFDVEKSWWLDMGCIWNTAGCVKDITVVKKEVLSTDIEYTSNPVCPHCGEDNYAEDCPGPNGVMCCIDCEEEFSFDTETMVVYTTSKRVEAE